MYVCIFWILSSFRTLRHRSASAADENSLLPLELALLFNYNFVTYTCAVFCNFVCIHCMLFVCIVLLLATHVASYCQLHNIKIILWGQVFTLSRHTLLKLCIYTYIAIYMSWKCKDKNIPIYAHYIQRFMLRQLIYVPRAND